MSSSKHRIVVGVAEMAVSNDPDSVLITYSLGSCLGIVAHDPVSGVGGLAHVMLPDSMIYPEKAATRPAMFVDTAVAALFGRLEQAGAVKGRTRVCAAGGAQILDSTRVFNIGERNVMTFRRLMAGEGTEIAAEDTGGLVTRTLYLDIESGEVWVRLPGQAQEALLCRS